MQARTLRSGELAKLAGISSDLLRHYERIGIVPKPARSANGYRRYSAATLHRVRAARRALSLGFTLQELARIFALRDSGSVPCRHVRTLATEKLRKLDTAILEMKQLRRELKAILHRWDGMLRSQPGGKPAHLLHSLESFSSTKLQRTKLKIGRSWTK